MAALTGPPYMAYRAVGEVIASRSSEYVTKMQNKTR
jgi:hypothetical protein